MKIKFTKMNGTGNDFILLNGYDNNINLTKKQICYLTHRNLGIGADQLLLIKKSKIKNTHFKCEIFNCDGEKVENCGNGLRCAAKFAKKNLKINSNKIYVEVNKKKITLKIKKDGNVSSKMNPPEFNTELIHFDTNNIKKKYIENDVAHIIYINSKPHEISTVSIGNPHAIQIVNNIKSYPIKVYGSYIENYPLFKNKVNAGFMQIKNRNEIKLRVYERGVGETLSCGTGACAAVVIGIRRKLLNNKVKVKTLGGILKVSWNGKNNSPITLKGNALFIFRGKINLI